MSEAQPFYVNSPYGITFAHVSSLQDTSFYNRLIQIYIVANRMVT